MLLDASKVHADPLNRPDKSGDEDMAGLVKSIQALGILHPIIVVPMPTRKGHFQLRAGERRWRAAQKAGHEQIFGFIRDPLTSVGRIDAALVTIVENCQRAAHNPVELAMQFGYLLDGGLKQADIARLTGLSPATVSYHCQLLKADQETLNKVRRGELTAGAVHEAVKLVAAADVDAKAGSVTILRPRRGGSGSGSSKLLSHFNATHRLAGEAARLCKLGKHRGRVKYGRVACGECWERAIAADALSGGAHSLDSAIAG